MRYVAGSFEPLRSMCALMGVGCLFLFIHTLADAEDAPESLASCRVKVLPAASAEENPAVMASPADQRPASVIAATYRRGPTGDWVVPTDVDRNSPAIRMLLITPSGPLLIELSVLVDGEGFRMFRERSIDEALQSPAPANDAVASSSSIDGEAEVPAASSVQRFQSADAVARLRKYASQPGTSVDRDEARWLLAQWSPGPGLLELVPTFAADRSRRAPLWAALDRDADGKLSAAEIATAVSRLHTFDANEDDWVDEAELTASPVIESWIFVPLLTVLNDATDWKNLAQQLRTNFETQPETAQPWTNRFLQRINLGSITDLTASQLPRLLKAVPDLSLQVRFATEDATESGLAVVDVADGWLPTSDALFATEDVVCLRLAGCVVEVAAAQPHASKDRESWNGQIAVGAVLDGEPLLRMVDEDNDRRLSLREIDAARQVLAELDRDHNGDVQISELLLPIRLVVTLGPHVQDVLGRAAHMPRRTGSTNSLDTPDWFAGMDRNKDGDLTMAEFLGTRDQFEQFDTNHDERISLAEAVQAAETSE